jgi:hypothetical protein
MNINFKMARFRFVVVVAVVGLLVLVGCDRNKVQYQQGTGSSAADAPQSEISRAAHDQSISTGGSTVLAGVTFTPPAAWQDLGPDGMRQAQYRLNPVTGDSAPGEVNAYYFGPASGGGVQANLDRWIGQMVMPDGGDPAKAAERGTFMADDMQGHLVSLNGSYKSGGGRPMGGDTTLLPGYRLVGVVLEGPQGSLFFKLTGPLATAQAMENDLLAMVQGARK